MAQSSFPKDSGWVILNEIEARIKEKIERVGVPLKDWDIQINYGIKTGYNEAFIIDAEKREELLKKCPEADEIIRPILKGRDIKKYISHFSNRYIIFTRRGIMIENYPDVEAYLSHFYDHLKPKTKDNQQTGRKPGQYKWFEIQDNVAYYKDFKKEKIVWLELSDEPKFAYDAKGFFAEATAFIMTGLHLKYLTAFLNSSLCDWYFDKITTTSGVGTNRWKKVYIEELKIPIPDQHREREFENLIDQINKEEISQYQFNEVHNEILIEIFKLYDFNPEEQEIIINFRQ